jgi:hypothetical protein
MLFSPPLDHFYENKNRQTKKIRQSGGPTSAGSMTLRPRLAAGLPFRNLFIFIVVILRKKASAYNNFFIPFPVTCVSFLAL